MINEELARKFYKEQFRQWNRKRQVELMLQEQAITNGERHEEILDRFADMQNENRNALSEIIKEVKSLKIQLNHISKYLKKTIGKKGEKEDEVVIKTNDNTVAPSDLSSVWGRQSALEEEAERMAAMFQPPKVEADLSKINISEDNNLSGEEPKDFMDPSVEIPAPPPLKGGKFARFR